MDVQNLSPAVPGNVAPSMVAPGDGTVKSSSETSSVTVGSRQPDRPPVSVVPATAGGRRLIVGTRSRDLFPRQARHRVGHDTRDAGIVRRGIGQRGGHRVGHDEATTNGALTRVARLPGGTRGSAGTSTSDTATLTARRAAGRSRAAAPGSRRTTGSVAPPFPPCSPTKGRWSQRRPPTGEAYGCA